MQSAESEGNSHLTWLENLLRNLAREGAEEGTRNVIREELQRAMRDDYMDKQALMELTGWSARTVEYKKSERKIPFIRRGRTILFPTDEIYDWLEEGRVEAQPDQ